MISHVSLHVSDYQKGKDFYAEVLKTLGYTIGQEYPPHAVGFKDRDGNHDFWMVPDGVKQTTHVCFGAQSQDEVQAFYDAALKAGGKDNGKPGWRKDYGPGYYAAFIHDPDGHNIEAMYWDDSRK